MHLLDFFRSAPLHERLLSSDAARNPALNWAIRHHTGLIVVALLLFIVCWQCFLYPAFFSPLRHLPGPPWGHWLLGQFGEIVKAEAGILQYEWARKYASNGEPCIRAVGPFGIERVIFLTPNAAQQILVDDVYDFPRPDFERNTLGEVTGHGLLTVEGEDHKQMRKMMTPAFSSAHLAQLVDLFYPPLEACVRVLNKQIEEKGGKDADSAVMDVYHIMSRCTLDIICDTAFGLKANSLEKGHELAEAYEQLIDLQSGQNLVMLILKTTLPGFNFMTHLSKPFLPKILVGPLDTLDDSMKRINAVSKKLIEEKTGAMSGDEAAQGKDVLSLLVAANKGDDGQSYLNEQQMMDQVLTFLGAGHETTASGMTWTLWLLANDQKRQDKLREECADLIARRIDPDQQQLNSLKYLEACVKESLRVMPPVPMTFRKARVPKTVEGVYLPKDTLIYMGNRVMLSLPELWGDDSKEFKPERWLDIPDDAKEEDKPGKSMHSYQVFIQGPHMCIGAAMAKLEMKAMLCYLLAHYKFELAEEGQTVTPTAAITMKPEGGLPLRVTRVTTAATALS